MMIAYGIEILDCYSQGKLNTIMNLLVIVTVFHDGVEGTAFILYHFKALPSFGVPEVILN
jgi:hypothetical protein